MSEQLTEDRAAVLAVLDEQTTDEERQEQAEAAERAELEERVQRLAPEAIAGDQAAATAVDEAQAALFALDKRVRLREIARREEARREQETADAAAEAQRNAWRAEQAKHEATRDDALARFEKQLPTALEAAREAIEENNLAASLQSSIKPGSGYRRLHNEVEVRLLRLVRDYLAMYGIRPDMIRESQGKTPLVAVAHDCAVCKHEQRAQIEAALDAGETLSAVVERFEGFSKSTLSRHGGHRG